MMDGYKDLALAEITAAHQGQQVQVRATIIDRRLIAANKQETICVLTLQDHTGSLQAVVAPPVYQSSSPLYEPGNEVLLAGTVDVRRKVTNILCLAIRVASEN